jgi:DNA/RNA-binding domain of Phe-tRNA-synthetase-like protein
MLKIREDLARSFPELEVLELELRGLRISEKDQRIEKLKITIQEEIRRSFPTLDQIKSYPIFRCYRDFFWRVGIDPTKNRPAAEALTRRVVSGKDLPTINTLVDSYNLASIKTSVAIAAFDLNKISGSDLIMRKAIAGETFLGIGMRSEMKLRGVEIVIEESKTSRLIAVYPYRDSDDTKVTRDSRDVLLMMCGVPGVPHEKLEEARNTSKELIQKFCSQTSAE